MSSKHHDWYPGENPPEIQKHSIIKHKVLRSYLEKYVSTLCTNVRREELKITLIDGFAGGGLYTDPANGELHYGSPFIMLQAIEEAMIIAQKKRLKDFNLDVNFIFVESKKRHFEFLRESIIRSPYRNLLDQNKIVLIHGNFVDYSSQIIEQSKIIQKNLSGQFTF